VNVLDFRERKAAGRKIVLATCYDYWSARLLDVSEVDCLLVGDSAAMVMHGLPSTLHATAELIALHTAAVSRGAPNKFLIADLPFPSFRLDRNAAMAVVDQLMKSGAQAVKLEGLAGHEEVIRHIVGSGVPVMGHLGLTPQAVHRLGGYRVQGRGTEGAQALLQDARRLEEVGCFSLVLEAVPSEAAARITAELEIPTIGIGAGNTVDGQVLVLQDLLGLSSGHTPRFVREFLNGRELIGQALDAFARAVRAGEFPGPGESYS